MLLTRQRYVNFVALAGDGTAAKMHALAAKGPVSDSFVSEDCADTVGNKPGVSFGYKRNISATGDTIFGDHRPVLASS
jgi:hypothetical protein